MFTPEDQEKLLGKLEEMNKINAARHNAIEQALSDPEEVSKLDTLVDDLCEYMYSSLIKDSSLEYISRDSMIKMAYVSVSVAKRIAAFAYLSLISSNTEFDSKSPEHVDFMNAQVNDLLTHMLGLIKVIPPEAEENVIKEILNTLEKANLNEGFKINPDFN